MQSHNSIPAMSLSLTQTIPPSSFDNVKQQTFSQSQWGIYCMQWCGDRAASSNSHFPKRPTPSCECWSATATWSQWCPDSGNGGRLRFILNHVSLTLPSNVTSRHDYCYLLEHNLSRPQSKSLIPSTQKLVWHVISNYTFKFYLAVIRYASVNLTINS